MTDSLGICVENQLFEKRDAIVKDVVDKDHEAALKLILIGLD